MIELSVIRDLVAIFGVIAGFSYYVLTVRNQQRNQQLQLETRQAQLFTQYIFQILTTESLKEYYQIFEMEWKDIEDFYRKYGLTTNPDIHAFRTRLFELLNILGTYVRNDLIGIELVNEAIGGGILRMWPKFRDVIEYERTHIYTSNYMRDMAYLYEETLKYREKIGQKLDANILNPSLPNR